MSWFRRLLQQAHKPVDVKSRHSPSVRYALEAMPTIKFDPSVVTKSVKADLQRNVELLAGVEKKHVKQVYELALRFHCGTPGLLFVLHRVDEPAHRRNDQIEGR